MSKSQPNCETRFESYFFSYEWKITEAEIRINKPEPLTCPESIKSPPGCHPATTWTLEALKDGGKDGYEVTLTLTSWGTVWVQVTMNATVWKGTRNICVTPYCRGHQYAKIVQCGSLTGRIPRDRFHDFTYDGSFTVHCHISVKHLEEPIHTINVLPSAEGVGNKPEHDLSKILEDARQKGQYTDVSIVTEESEFKAHKLVLVTQSSFFATRLEERWMEGSGNRIDMRDVPSSIMEALLIYMYTGKIVNGEKTAYELLPRAEEYQLECLKADCEVTLGKSLTAEKVIDVLMMADTHNADLLKEACLTYIARNIVNVKKSSAWSEEKLKTNKDLWGEAMEHIVQLI